MTNKFSRDGGFFHLSSISWGTLRDQDLISAFTDELERLAPFNYHSLRYEAREWLEDDAAGRNPPHGAEIVNDLFDKLNDVAAFHNAYFGASEGDGADFGFFSYDEDTGYEEDEFSDDYDAVYPALDGEAIA